MRGTRSKTLDQSQPVPGQTDEVWTHLLAFSCFPTLSEAWLVQAHIVGPLPGTSDQWNRVETSRE